MTKFIQIEKPQAELAIVSLNRPERRNALCIEMLDELCESIEAMASSGRERVVILKGNGAVFSSGMDLSEASNPALASRSAQCISRTLRLMGETSLVTIAAVHGGAYAGGAGLMASCDIAIATSDARIGFPEARRGLLPALISSVLMSKIRKGDLSELFLVGEAIDASRAQQIGLVQRSVEPSDLMKVATELVAGILEGGPETIVATKQLLNHTASARDLETNSSMIEVHMAARHSTEAAEGLAAFLEKRRPSWSPTKASR